MKMKPGAKKLLIISLIVYIGVIGIFLYGKFVYDKKKAETIQQLKDNFRPEFTKFIKEHLKGKPYTQITSKEIEEALNTFFEKKGNIIAVNYTVIMQILNFCILLSLMYGLLWQPLIDFLDSRRNHITSQIQQAENNRMEAERILQQYQQQLAEAKGERNRIIEEGKMQAYEERKNILDQAHKEASLLIEKAKEQIQQEVESVKKELKKESAMLSLLIAEKLLEKNISTEDNKKFVEEFINNLPSKV